VGYGKKWPLAHRNTEMGQDRTNVTIDGQYEVNYMLLIGANINDLG